MATANLNEAITRTETVVVVPETVTLTLTMNEAQTIADIFAKVGGSPDGSRRGYVEAVSDALLDAGVRWGEDDGYGFGTRVLPNDISGNINFRHEAMPW